MEPRDLHRLAPLLLASTLACGLPGPEESEDANGEAPAGPLDRAGYTALLEAAAGGRVPVDRVIEAAVAAATRIEERMDELAAEVGEPGGWLPLFARLRRDAPVDEAAVLAAYRLELSRAADFTDEHELVGMPPAPPQVVVLENPSLRAHFPLALYHQGRFAVTTAAAEGDDADYLANHCRVCVPPLAVHEGYPGHHVAFARMSDGGGAAPSMAELARFKPYVEGWALYAEVLMLERGYYEDPERRLAAWRLVLLRLLRAEIDARLHGGDLDPAAAEELYRRRLLLTPAAAAAELRTHLAKPTVKASYFVGLIQILELREALRAAAPDQLPRPFHDRLLGPPAPVPRIARERFALEMGPWGETDLPWPWSAADATEAG